ncbi:peptidase inhibitor family I36 protein [Nocardiopsis sp. CA-288880]|uniref:peptidase inhibitor family I36 protein n=1 Tax=Nocardiopsis sp. CA-288880 TaxID=3239995 RepID=UPI003D976A6A
MRIKKAVVALATVGLMATGLFAASPAHAGPTPETTSASSSTLGVLNGEVIDLSTDEHDAKVCMEENGKPFRCYDDVEEYRTAVGLPPGNVETLNKSDCSDGFLCLWDNAQFKVSLVQVRGQGTYNVPQDKANSLWNRTDRPAQIIDVRSWQPDHTMSFGPGAERADLGALSTPWNNRVDKVRICPETGC